MAEHIINGRKIEDGQLIHYTGRNGAKRVGVLKQVHAVYYADIQAKDDDGTDRFMERVPFNPTGVHAWNHIPEDEQAEMQRGNADGPVEAVDEDDTPTAPVAKLPRAPR